MNDFSKFLIDEYGMTEEEASQTIKEWLARKTLKDEMIEREEQGDA